MVVLIVLAVLLESECTFALPDISDEKLLKKGYVVGGMYGLRDKPSTLLLSLCSDVK